MNSYDLLLERLDQFIRKFYLNKIIRGLLYALGLVLVLFVTFTLLEYKFYFSTGIRKTFYFSFIAISILAFGYWVFNPLLKYFKLGKAISHDDAASIIGNHFSDVKDQLINILQLKKQSVSHHNELINASISQKSEKIKFVPFKKAIDLSKNKKYLRYTLPPLLLLLAILFAAPSVITESTKRIIQNNKVFEKEAPFAFKLENDNDLSVLQFENLPITLKLEGEAYPDKVFIKIDNFKYKLKKESPNTFTYTFNNVQEAKDFHFEALGFNSNTYHLNINYKPGIVDFQIDFDYPDYIDRKNDKVTGIGDMVVPQGTKVKWNFNTVHTKSLDLKFSKVKNKIHAKAKSETIFTHHKTIMSNESYKVFVVNDAVPNGDSIFYNINTIPDLHPNIHVKEFVDSLDKELVYFVGDASDDYGLGTLNFTYRISNKSGQGINKSIPIKKEAGRAINFEHSFDIAQLNAKQGDEITYFFEIWDNDAVNGSKSTKTRIFSFKLPSIKELEEKEDKNSKDIKDKLKETIEESKKIKEDFKKLREKVLQKKDLDWETRKELEKLLERQKELEKNIQESKDKFQENLENQEKIDQPNEEILEKQEKIQEMFEEAISPEMQELIKKMEEMLQEMNKDEALEEMEEMKMNDEELNQELDRMLELFKQLELEYQLQQEMEKLEKLAEEQKKLAEETENQEKPKDQLKKEQEEINKKFEDIQKKMEDLDKKNKELEKPMDLDNPEEKMEDIQKDLDKSKEELENNDSKKASKKQKDAAEKMEQMAEQMKAQMEQGQAEQMEEDMEALRQILENLLEISFEQEDLQYEFETERTTTPRYVDLVQGQFKLKDDFKIVEDSLVALSKRVFQIESFVTEKLTEVKKHMKKGLKELEDRKTNLASVHQQHIMKNVNDLALMLSEVLNQMQQQMANKKPGSQMCNNPGKGQPKNGGKPSDKISKGQKQMKDALGKMQQKMKNGKGGESKEFAKMAQRQAALRKALEKKQKDGREQGKGGDKELQQLIDEMNKIEKDLVNKRLNNGMMARQKKLIDNLLKHEKAEREKEYDNKRKSQQGVDKERKKPAALEEYLNKRKNEIEQLKSVSPDLKPYYKKLVEDYINSLKTK